jgi:hypothetical protein
VARIKREPLGPPVIVDEFVSVHPALDFWQHRNGTGETSYHAITSVGQHCRQNFNTGDVDLFETSTCITSDGEVFQYSKRELANRSLFYTKNLDLPAKRWQHQDMVEFTTALREGTATPPTVEEVFKRIKATIDFFMDFEDKRIYDLLSTFIIYTYFYPLFHSAPILQLWGEAKTGKSKVCNLIASMAFNTLNSSNISEATIFRVIEGRRATILLDESEDLMNSDRGRAICNLLLAGYSKSGETFRQEKSSDDKYKTANYKVFGPKIIANIGGVSLPALFTRMIRIITQGALNVAKANRDVDVENPVFLSIRNSLYQLTLTGSKQLVLTRDDLPDTTLNGKKLNDRNRGIWEGLLTIASLINEQVWENMLTYAHENSQLMQDEIDATSSGSALLKQLFLMTDENGDRIYRISEIMAWTEHNENLVITSKHDLGNLMKKLGFKSKPKRDGSEIYRVYDLTNSEIMQRMKRI